jgi:hypothetical protein
MALAIANHCISRDEYLDGAISIELAELYRDVD